MQPARRFTADAPRLREPSLRALFGVVGLLLTLAIVGIVAVKQLNAVGRSVGATSPAGGSASAAQARPEAASNGTIVEQSKQIQDKVRSDVAKALEQGAARTEEAAK